MVTCVAVKSRNNSRFDDFNEFLEWDLAINFYLLQ
jgi:hypothetical protein